jgi:NAD(P)-dependent dehydrogenase (short-subunit alcohol dehydrogenase family)
VALVAYASKVSDVYNASHRVRAPFVEVDAEAVARAADITAIAAFRVAQHAVRCMLPDRHGAMLFTGASAWLKGFAHSAAFAMGKFALRGLAQSMRTSWRHKESMLLMSSSTAQSGPSARRTMAKTRCSTPTPLRPPTSTCLHNRAASGPGASKCGRGSSAFD